MGDSWATKCPQCGSIYVHLDSPYPPKVNR
jgi:hypothetical protein